MTSGCLDRKEVRGAIWGVHSTTDRPAGGNTGRLFLAFGGPVCADRISNCPLDRVLTYKNLIYLLNLQFCARAFTKERSKPRVSSLSKIKESQIKVCEQCFLCHFIVLCSICTKCPKCCAKSTCRGPTPKLLANLARSRGQSDSGLNLEGGLHPPLPDPTKSYKVPYSRKLLCQSPQEQLPVGGITSAYGQTCNRTGPQSNIPGVFQPTLPSPKTQQQMEANTGSEQTKYFPQGGKIQNGDTGNHQNIPPKTGVGHLGGLQGRLLPHTNTGTIQEVPPFSYSGPDLPIQSSAFWSVHSAYGVHCVSKGGETDGHAQGYKDPPVPRRLVGESRIPTSLSPPHPDSSQNVPGTWLAGKYGKIRTGTQTDFRFCRLPVRPPSRPGQTDQGLVAKPSGQNTSTIAAAGLSGPSVYVTDRFTNSHRKTDSPRPTTHETHTVVSQKQLEGPRIFRKDHPSTQFPAPSSAMVVRRKQCATRPTITPSRTCSTDLYRHIKRRVGRSLKRAHCKGLLVGAGKQTAHKLSTVKSSLSSSQRVPRTMYRQDNSSGIRQHYGSGLYNKEGGMRSGPLCALLWRILTWCSQKQVTLKARHIPGHLNVIADKLSRLGQTIQTEWSLLLEVFISICKEWHQPQIDLFATRFNHKLPQFVSPVPDPLAVAVDALTLPWEDLDAYAFPPTSILGKVVEKLLDSRYQRVILIAPGWPNMPWFWDLVAMSNSPQPTKPAQSLDTAVQPDPSQESGKPESPCMAPRATAIKEQGFSKAVAARIEAPQRKSTRSVYEAKWTIFTKWCITNQVDFRSPPIKSVADFLLYLFEIKNLQPSTIDGYRSAIADKLGNITVNISKDDNLTRLLDSFHRDRPKGRRGIPSWNLSLDLHQLTKAPFEPLKEASMKHLTFKTVFLLALGSGKRRSEIHAWLQKNIRHQSDWSKVSLVPSPSFLSKNQLAKEGPESVAPVVIPALAPTLDRSLKSDRTLCPVRALRYYLDRTSDFRQGKELVFVSFKKGFDKDISPATISSWIKQTVILCYELSDQQAHTLHQVKAHDVRAFAASKAFQSGVSLEQILAACHWKSHNTFTQFYLKDVAWADSELYHLGPVVAAQQIHQGTST